MGIPFVGMNVLAVIYREFKEIIIQIYNFILRKKKKKIRLFVNSQILYGKYCLLKNNIKSLLQNSYMSDMHYHIFLNICVHIISNNKINFFLYSKRDITLEHDFIIVND